MNNKKKLFNSDDFDKKKKLFTPSDFDKESEDNIRVEDSKAGNETPEDGNKKIYSKSKNWIWIVPGVITACIICFFVFSKSGDAPAMDSAQETEVVEENVALMDSVSDKEDTTGETRPIPGNEVFNKDDDHYAKVGQEPTDANSNVAASSTGSTVSTNVSSDVEAEAMRVIRGDYGVGQERKDRLGSKYKPIQSRVNELKREGMF